MIPLSIFHNPTTAPSNLSFNSHVEIKGALVLQLFDYRLQFLLSVMKHQGKFMKDMRCPATFHETLPVRWLVKGRLKSQTEALILAAQDDCIYTRSFKANCMGNAGDTHCCQCSEDVETVRHILSQCRPKGFNLYMEQHDRALLVVYYYLSRHYALR